MELPALRHGAGTIIGKLQAMGYTFAVARPEDMDEVRVLRRRAYLRAGKIREQATLQDMDDPPSLPTTVLVARLGEVLVGAVSITLCSPRAPLVHELLGAQVDRTRSPLDETAEVFKFCIHPHHWGEGLFPALVSLASLYVLARGRRYTIQSATERLAPAYVRFGMERTGESYVHPTMGTRHFIVHADVLQCVRGVRVNPLLWNVASGWEIWRYVEPSWCLRPLAYRLLAPVARLVA